MTTHSILVEEFATDPLGYGYDTMSDQERYDKLLLTDIPILIPIPAIKVSGYLEFIDKWDQMNQLSVIDQSQTPPVPRNETAYHMVLVLGTFDSFDMNDTAENDIFTGLLNALVSNNILTQTEADTLEAYGDSLTNRATQLGVGDIGLGKVIDARVA